MEEIQKYFYFFHSNLILFSKLSDLIRFFYLYQFILYHNLQSHFMISFKLNYKLIKLIKSE